MSGSSKASKSYPSFERNKNLAGLTMELEGAKEGWRHYVRYDEKGNPRLVAEKASKTRNSVK